VQQSLEKADQVFIARLRFSTLTTDERYPTMITEDAEFVRRSVQGGIAADFASPRQASAAVIRPQRP
jgi:hypothetical protein